LIPGTTILKIILQKKKGKERETSFLSHKPLVALLKNSHVYHVFTYIYFLQIEKDICDRQNISIKFFRVFVCAIPLEISSFFSKSFPISCFSHGLVILVFFCFID